MLALASAENMVAETPLRLAICCPTAARMQQPLICSMLLMRPAPMASENLAQVERGRAQKRSHVKCQQRSASAGQQCLHQVVPLLPDCSLQRAAALKGGKLVTPLTAASSSVAGAIACKLIWCSRLQVLTGGQQDCQGAHFERRQSTAASASGDFTAKHTLCSDDACADSVTKIN